MTGDSSLRRERCSETAVVYLRASIFLAQPVEAVGKGETFFSLGKFVPVCFLLTPSSPAQGPFLHPEVEMTHKSLQLLSQGYLHLLRLPPFHFLPSLLKTKLYSLQGPNLKVSFSRKTSLTLHPPRLGTYLVLPLAPIILGPNGPE